MMDTDDRQRTMPGVWHKLPTGELKRGVGNKNVLISILPPPGNKHNKHNNYIKIVVYIII